MFFSVQLQHHIMMIVILYILDNIEVTHLKSLKKEDVLDFYKVDVIK